MKEQNEKQDTDRSASILEIAQKIVTKNFLKHAENVLKLNKQLIVENQIYDDLSSCGWDIFVDQRCKRFAAEHLARCGYSKQSEVIDEFAERLKEKMDDIARMEYNGDYYFLVSKSFIDKIAAEMKGGEE